MLKSAREGMQVVILSDDVYYPGKRLAGAVATVESVPVGRGRKTSFGMWVYLKINETGEHVHIERAKLTPLSKIDRTKKRLNYVSYK